MRPPPPRNFVGLAQQIRPRFATAAGPQPPTSHAVYAATDNRDSLMTQACIVGHEHNALPLREVNRYRSKDPQGDYSRSAPRPRLPRRPAERAPILVRTFE